MKARVPWWLWLGSAVWLVAVFCIAWFVFWPADWKSVKPNEFGDLLAGAFSPVAFAWFVYAVFMQREELELQRQELTETREVLKDQKSAQEESASQAKRLAILTENQIDINVKSNYVELVKFYLEAIDKFNLETNHINYISGGTILRLDTSYHPVEGSRSSRSVLDISNDIDMIGDLIKNKKLNLLNENNKKLNSYFHHMSIMIEELNAYSTKNPDVNSVFLGAGYARMQYVTNKAIDASRQKDE